MTKFIYKCTADITSKDYDLITDSFQESIDWWSIQKSVGGRPYVFISTPETEDRVYRTINSRETIKEWADYLMLNNYNRVERRIMKEMKEQETNGMEIVEVKEDDRYEDTELFDMQGGIATTESVPYANLNFHGNFKSMSAKEQDEIINPKHYKMIPKEAYNKHSEGLEYMDLMEYILEGHSGVQSHLLGQVFKYACRLGKKDAKLQDAKKIAWYANRLVEVIEDER